MKVKALAVVGDLVMVVILLASAIGLLISGPPLAGVNSDKLLYPLSLEGSRLTLLISAIGVVVGMLIALVRPRRRSVVNGEIVRYSGLERLVHWSVVIGYLLSFGTAVIMLRWLGLASSVETRPLVYLLHFIGAAVLVFAAAAFATAYRARGADGLFPRWSDISPAIARVFAYLGVYGERGVLGLRLPGAWAKSWQEVLSAMGIRPRPREEKFLAAERVLSFTPLAILTLIVVATGLAKAARYFFYVPPDLYRLATTVHDYAVWGTLVIVGLHIAAIVLVPRNWPGLRAMSTGRISREVVAEEFAAWDDQLRADDGNATSIGTIAVANRTQQ